MDGWPWSFSSVVVLRRGLLENRVFLGVIHPSCWGTSKYQKVISHPHICLTLQSTIWKRGQQLDNLNQLGHKLVTKVPWHGFSALPTCDGAIKVSNVHLLSISIQPAVCHFYGRCHKDANLLLSPWEKYEMCCRAVNKVSLREDSRYDWGVRCFQQLEWRKRTSLKAKQDGITAQFKNC